MKKYKKLSLFLFLVLSAFPGLNLSAQKPSGDIVKHISGIATNPSGYPLADLRIVFESNEMYVEAITDKNGMYNLKMPTGFYEVRTNDWIGKLPYSENETLFSNDCPAYFRPHQRSAIKFFDDAVLNLTLMESGCFSDIVEKSLGAFPGGSHGSGIEKVKYASLPIKFSYLSIGIQHHYVKEKDNKTTYTNANFVATSRDIKNLKHGVLVTYDLKNINAAEVVYDRRNHLLTLSGDVILEESGKTESFRKIKIKIQKNPVFTFIK